MDWLYITMPVAGIEVLWIGLVILGLGVGIIGGFFGMGGAWMVTPGLNILGFPMAFAIGTDITHMAGKSIIATRRHAKFGNVDYKLGLVMVIGTVLGFEIGAQMVMWLERIGKIETYLRWGYLVLLTFIGWVVFADVGKRTDKQWHKTLQKISIPPVVTFQTAGIRCSIWLPIVVSLFTGWLAGLFGIGGGLIRMPALIYLVGVPTHVAVGTDLFEVAVSGLYGAATYTYKGRTELLAAAIMLVGAAVGAQIGTVATKYVHGHRIRSFFGFAVVGCAISVALKLVGSSFPDIRVICDRTATVLILGLVTVLSSAIVIKFIIGARAERALNTPRST